MGPCCALRSVLRVGRLQFSCCEHVAWAACLTGPGGRGSLPKKVGGFAHHSLESLPGPPGPARLQNAPPKIRPECVQVPSSKGYGARRYTPTPAPPESKGRKINEESAPGHRPDWCWCMSSGSPGEQLKTKAYTGGGGARGSPSRGGPIVCGGLGGVRAPPEPRAQCTVHSL